MRRLWVVALAFAVVLASGCKRRKIPPELLAEEEAPAEPAVSSPAVKPPPPAPVALPPRPPPPPPQSGDAIPARAPEPALGISVPEGAREISRGETTRVFSVPYEVERLRRFFRRELPGARIEKRKFGFRVQPVDREGWILVTRDRGETRIAVFRPSYRDLAPPLRPAR
jgi:hypothetical protein